MRRQLVGAKTRLTMNAKADHSLAHVVDTLRAVRRSVKRWRVPAIAASPSVADLANVGYSL